MKNFPFNRVSWINSGFLIGTLLIALIGVPLYLWQVGFHLSDWIIFFFMYCATGMSITFGYHRCFAHKAFETRLPVRILCLLFGAAAFEDSAIEWVSDHRRHHRHTDHDDDPYDISKGFWWAHMGWIMFKLQNEHPSNNVPDLKKDYWFRWQDKYWRAIAISVGLILPTIIGGLCGHFLNEGQTLWTGMLGGLIVGGCLRVVTVQHSTFCINSLCHYLGNQPYSKKCSARDSFLMALVTFGEGYHNYHHEFQSDYRNGVKPWQFDPTKWMIYVMSKLKLTRNLRTISAEKIQTAEEKMKGLSDHKRNKRSAFP